MLFFWVKLQKMLLTLTGCILLIYRFLPSLILPCCEAALTQQVQHACLDLGGCKKHFYLEEKFRCFLFFFNHTSQDAAFIRCCICPKCSVPPCSLECWVVEETGLVDSNSQKLAEMLSQVLVQACEWNPTIWSRSFPSMEGLCDVSRH